MSQNHELTGTGVGATLILWLSGLLHFLLNEAIPWLIRFAGAVVVSVAFHFARSWLIRKASTWLGLNAEQKENDDV